MKTIIKLIAVFLIVACSTPNKKESTASQSEISETQYKAGLNRVTFDSEGIKLVGDLYLPENFKAGDQVSGIIVGGSWTTVKEQMAGLYASKLSEKGYAALAFDHRYYGESGGEPRFVELPAAKTEDFINAVKFMQSLPMINSEKVGGMAVCASGGYMAEAIATDDNFKSFAAVVPWFNTDEVVNAFYGGEEGINDRIEKSRAANKQYEESGEMSYIPAISDTDPNAAMFGPFGYYLDENIGRVPNWSDDKFALASWEPWLTYRPVDAAKQITIPTLIITSQNAATPAADEEFFNNLQGEKEMVWLEGGQLDFYYQPEQVDKSVELLAGHYAKTL